MVTEQQQAKIMQARGHEWRSDCVRPVQPTAAGNLCGDVLPQLYRIIINLIFDYYLFMQLIFCIRFPPFRGLYLLTVYLSSLLFLNKYLLLLYVFRARSIIINCCYLSVYYVLWSPTLPKRQSWRITAESVRYAAAHIIIS